MHNGLAIRKIRIDKGLTQQQVSSDILSQSNYSKFELGKIDVSLTSFDLILKKLDISYPEFMFVKNNYNLNTREQIIYDFYNLRYNNVNDLERIKERAQLLNDSSKDNLLQNIISICEALTILATSGEVEEARKKVENVWKRLEKIDKWYINDIKIINVILFLFDLNTAIHIMKRAITAIEPYKKYNEYTRLSISLKLNCSLLLIKKNYFEFAISLLNDVVNESKQCNSYLELGIAIVRKGICLSNIGRDGSFYIKKGLSIIHVSEDKSIFNLLHEEINKYCSISYEGLG